MEIQSSSRTSWSWLDLWLWSSEIAETFHPNRQRKECGRGFRAAPRVLRRQFPYSLHCPEAHLLISIYLDLELLGSNPYSYSNRGTWKGRFLPNAKKLLKITSAENKNLFSRQGPATPISIKFQGSKIIPLACSHLSSLPSPPFFSFALPSLSIF